MRPMYWIPTGTHSRWFIRIDHPTRPLPNGGLATGKRPRSSDPHTLVWHSLEWRLQWDNRPICVYANNCKSPDLVRVRGVLYYSSAGVFLLQLEQACSFCLPSAVPLANAGLRAGKEGDRVYEWGTGSLNAW
jgi:hypothetical protein